MEDIDDREKLTTKDLLSIIGDKETQILVLRTKLQLTREQVLGMAEKIATLEKQALLAAAPKKEKGGKG